MEHDGPSEHCPADAPYAIGALPMARSMLDRSLAGDHIPTAEQEDSGELRESPLIPEQGQGLSRSATRDEHDESDDHDGPDASYASGDAARGRYRTELQVGGGPCHSRDLET
jgi:hypothetical protein